MENNNEKKELRLTTEHLSLSALKVECLKIADKHSFSFNQLTDQTKKLFELMGFNEQGAIGQITIQAIS